MSAKRKSDVSEGFDEGQRLNPLVQLRLDWRGKETDMDTTWAMYAIICTGISAFFGLLDVANRQTPWLMLPYGVLAVVFWCLAIV
jgi:hypothetical protein